MSFASSRMVRQIESDALEAEPSEEAESSQPDGRTSGSAERGSKDQNTQWSAHQEANVGRRV